MAKLRIFSVQDLKTGVFMKPFMDMHIGSALRSWEAACNDKASPFCTFPSDFVLFEVGEFDDLQGILTSFDVPRRLSTAIEMLKRPEGGDPLFSKSVSQ